MLSPYARQLLLKTTDGCTSPIKVTPLSSTDHKRRFIPAVGQESCRLIISAERLKRNFSFRSMTSLQRPSGVHRSLAEIVRHVVIIHI